MSNDFVPLLGQDIAARIGLICLSERTDGRTDIAAAGKELEHTAAAALKSPNSRIVPSASKYIVVVCSQQSH